MNWVSNDSTASLAGMFEGLHAQDVYSLYMARVSPHNHVYDTGNEDASNRHQNIASMPPTVENTAEEMVPKPAPDCENDNHPRNPFLPTESVGGPDHSIATECNKHAMMVDLRTIRPIHGHSVVEIFGEASTGKTNTCLSLIAATITASTVEHPPRGRSTCVVLSKTPSVYISALSKMNTSDAWHLRRSCTSVEDGHDLVSPQRSSVPSVLAHTGVYQATSCADLFAFLEGMLSTGGTTTIPGTSPAGSVISRTQQATYGTGLSHHKKATSSPSQAAAPGALPDCLTCAELRTLCYACQSLHLLRTLDAIDGRSATRDTPPPTYVPSLVVIDPITFFIPDYNPDFRFTPSKQRRGDDVLPHHDASQHGKQEGDRPGSYLVGGYGPGLYHQLSNLMKSISARHGITFITVNEVSDVFNPRLFIPSSNIAARHPAKRGFHALYDTTSSYRSSNDQESAPIDLQFLQQLESSINQESSSTEVMSHGLIASGTTPTQDPSTTRLYGYPYYTMSCQRLVKARLGMSWAHCPHIRIALSRTRRNELMLNDYMGYHLRNGITPGFIDRVLNDLTDAGIVWEDRDQQQLLGPIYAALHHCIGKITAARQITYIIPSPPHHIHTRSQLLSASQSVVLADLDAHHDQHLVEWLHHQSASYHDSLDPFVSYAMLGAHPTDDDLETPPSPDLSSLSSVRIAHLMQSPSSIPYSQCYVILANRVVYIGVPFVLE